MKALLYLLRCNAVALLAGVASAVAAEPPGMTTTASGLRYVITHRGKGALAQTGEVVIYHYKGTLPDGTVFDSTFDRQQPFAFTLGKHHVIPGVEEAFAHFRVGDKGTMILPPALAYGAKPRGSIPPDSTLRFDIEVLDIKASGLADLLQDIIDTTGLAAAKARFGVVRAVQFEGLYVDEAQLNRLGYHYLGKTDKLPEALAVLQWAVELFPHSANAYDSYAEALLKAGQTEAARQAYEKSLALDPRNQNAAKILAGWKQ